MKITHKSNRGKTRHTDIIFFEVNDAKSLASYVLLKDQLMKQDEDYIERGRLIAKRINFSREYLLEMQREKGSITCTYCGKTDLVIELQEMKVPNDRLATVDHIVPKSRGGAHYDRRNIAPCCGTCNTKKGNKMLEEAALLDFAISQNAAPTKTEIDNLNRQFKNRNQFPEGKKKIATFEP